MGLMLGPPFLYVHLGFFANATTEKPVRDISSSEVDDTVCPKEAIQKKMSLLKNRPFAKSLAPMLKN